MSVLFTLNQLGMVLWFQKDDSCYLILSVFSQPSQNVTTLFFPKLTDISQFYFEKIYSGKKKEFLFKKNPQQRIVCSFFFKSKIN